jgi:acid phosphatase type 7
MGRRDDRAGPLAVAALLAAPIAAALSGCWARAEPGPSGRLPEASPTEGRVTAPSAETAPSPRWAPVLAVGDLADCRGPDAQVAALVRSSPGAVLLLGDLAYPDKAPDAWRACFLALYGPLLDRVHPVPGDNEHELADDYWATFAGRAGTPAAPWYRLEVGTWEVLVLDSTCEAVGGCGPDSAQYRWLADQLAASTARCRLAAWHLPRFTSSPRYREIPRLGPMFALLHDAGTDVLLVANSHHYERFDPLDPAGEPSERGVRQFTVGTGGAHPSGFGDPRPGSAFRLTGTYGVLALDLGDGEYRWRFRPVEGAEPLDEGVARCL